ncbi:MAG: DUF2147 domain-containing protein [Pseudomonadota bacterium]
MRTLPVIAAALAAVWLSAAPALADPVARPDGPAGRWRTDNGNLEVEIARCGAAFCGTVVKVLANRSMSGNGEMAAADARSPLGMTILKDLVPSGDSEWQGELYNRENAKTYSCRLSLDGPDQLVVRPYVGLPLFGKTLVWARVAAERN